MISVFRVRRYPRFPEKSDWPASLRATRPFLSNFLKRPLCVYIKNKLALHLDFKILKLCVYYPITVNDSPPVLLKYTKYTKN